MTFSFAWLAQRFGDEKINENTIVKWINPDEPLEVTDKVIVEAEESNNENAETENEKINYSEG